MTTQMLYKIAGINNSDLAAHIAEQRTLPAQNAQMLLERVSGGYDPRNYALLRCAVEECRMELR